MLAASGWKQVASITELALLPSLRERVLQPGQRKEEQGREHMAEEEIHPDQRREKGAQSESDPQGAERSMSLQRPRLREWYGIKLQLRLGGG